jgi:uncharacterized damage-inducible protein DinB
MSHIIVPRPSPDEYPAWAEAEISLVPYQDLILGLEDSHTLALQVLDGLSADTLTYRYAEGKWSIKQVWQHVMDVERIFNYRALRYARQDKTVLSGFNQNEYNEVSHADAREWTDMIREYKAIRQGTVELFKSFTEEMFSYVGQAGKSPMTVRSVGYLIIGHEMHHLNIIRDRYLSRIGNVS